MEPQKYLDKFIRCEGFLTQTNNKMKVFSDLSINYRLRTIQRGRDAKEQTIYCRIILKGNRLDRYLY